MRFFLCILCFFASCSPSSPQDFMNEGRALTSDFLKDLKEVRSNKDLKKRESSLRKKYQKLAKLILMVQSLEDLSDKGLENELEDELYYEMERIYLLPGCREILEKVQEDALTILECQGTR